MPEHLDLPGTFCLFTEQVAQDQDRAERTFHVAEAKVGQALHQGWEGARVPEDSGARVPQPGLSTAPSLLPPPRPPPPPPDYEQERNLAGSSWQAPRPPRASVQASFSVPNQSYSELEQRA